MSRIWPEFKVTLHATTIIERAVELEASLVKLGQAIDWDEFDTNSASR